MDKCYNHPNKIKVRVSLCIPRLSGETDKTDISKKFNELGVGKVYKVDMIWKTSDKGEKFYSAFIHIDWNESELSKYIIERVTSGKDVKIIYDGFLFWKVFLNKSYVSKNNCYLSKTPTLCGNLESCSSGTWERNSKIM